MTLILGLQPKLRLDNKSGLGECFMIQRHPHKCEGVFES